MNNLNPMFLCGIHSRHTVKVVNTFKNKTSTHVNFKNMCTLADVVHSIVKPLTSICRLSFQTGTFSKDIVVVVSQFESFSHRFTLGMGEMDEHFYHDNFWHLL